VRGTTLALIVSLAITLLSGPVAADAQQAGKVPQIGFLAAVTPLQPNLDAFRQGLRERGYVEGQNLAIEYRFAEGKYERLPGLASELVQLKVDVIVVLGTPPALAAKDATRTTPIVMLAVGDPVGTELVTSLARPGGNITGVSLLAPELVGKQLQLLTEAVPKVSRVAILSNPRHALHPLMLRETEVPARELGVQLQILEVRSPNEFDSTFSAVTRERAAGLLVLPDPMFFRHRTRIADLAAKHRLPWVGAEREYAEAGGLMSYAWSLAERHHRAAYFVDRILKGAKPADLPVEQPTKFELVVNLKTAKALGLTIPQAVLIRADHVIQ